MQPKNQLPKGFITVDEAIKLINSDSRENAKVDISYMVRHIQWIESHHNFRIPRIKAIKNSKGQVTGFEKTGSVYVKVPTTRDAENLKYAIREKYKEEAKRDYNEDITRGVSTVADDGEGLNAVQPRKTSGNKKKGDSISGGAEGPITTNGENLNV